jgi:nicotinamidase/pyrazinamidase
MHTKGAELVPSLKKEKIASIFYKGSDKWVDSYSAFFDNARLRKTGLEDYLKKRGINELYIVGVATDYCVLYSVLDALDLGFAVTVIQDACRGINLQWDDEERSLLVMKQKGARLLNAYLLL